MWPLLKKKSAFLTFFYIHSFSILFNFLEKSWQSFWIPVVVMLEKLVALKMQPFVGWHWKGGKLEVFFPLVSFFPLWTFFFLKVLSLITLSLSLSLYHFCWHLFLPLLSLWCWNWRGKWSCQDNLQLSDFCSWHCPWHCTKGTKPAPLILPGI